MPTNTPSLEDLADRADEAFATLMERDLVDEVRVIKEYIHAQQKHWLETQKIQRSVADELLKQIKKKDKGG